MQHGRIIRPDGTEESVEPRNRKTFSLEELQAIVGGNIEIIKLGPGNNHATMYANEEGKLLDLPRNETATKLMSPLHMDGDFVSGTAIIVSGNRQA